jgi:hypothetical protein
VLREQGAGLKTADLCRKHGISGAIFYAWKAKYGGLGVSESKRLKTDGRRPALRVRLTLPPATERASDCAGSTHPAASFRRPAGCSC